MKMIKNRKEKKKNLKRMKLQGTMKQSINKIPENRLPKYNIRAGLLVFLSRPVPQQAGKPQR